MTERIERFVYDDAIVRMFMLATLVWGFGRLRPLHTNAVIFAFAGNAIFAGRLLLVAAAAQGADVQRQLSRLPLLGLAGDHRRRGDHAAPRLHPGQGVRRARVADRHRDRRRVGGVRRELLRDGAPSAASGTSTSRSGSTSRRSSRSRSCTSSTTSSIPAGLFKSYSIYAGVQDAFMQWWYGHNAVAFFLTTPFLGLMYYFLPKAANRPVFCYRLSILHFWSLVFIYIWAGPHHLHYTALPAVGLDARHDLQRHAVDAVVGRHDQRPADAARRLEQGRRGSGPQVLRRRHHVLRHGDVRGADALDQERQRAVALHRLDHRARPRRRARLGRAS